MNINDTIKKARRILRLGNTIEYETIMIQALRLLTSSDDIEVMIKAGKQDGYSFRQYGLRTK